MEKWGYFQHEKYRYHIARLFIQGYFGNGFRSTKKRYGQFFQTKGSFKEGFLAYVLLGCFHNFCWIPIMNHGSGSW